MSAKKKPSRTSILKNTKKQVHNRYQGEKILAKLEAKRCGKTRPSQGFKKSKPSKNLCPKSKKVHMNNIVLLEKSAKLAAKVRTAGSSKSPAERIELEKRFRKRL
jgi:hypothetical protein